MLDLPSSAVCVSAQQIIHFALHVPPGRGESQIIHLHFSCHKSELQFSRPECLILRMTQTLLYFQLTQVNAPQMLQDILWKKRQLKHNYTVLFSCSISLHTRLLDIKKNNPKKQSNIVWTDLLIL